MAHNDKKRNKLVSGIIIGGALGSILGMALAPKPGKETREIITQKSKGVFGSFMRGVKAIFRGKR